MSFKKKYIQKQKQKIGVTVFMTDYSLNAYTYILLPEKIKELKGEQLEPFPKKNSVIGRASHNSLI